MLGTGEKLIGEQMGIPEIVQTKRTQAARELQAQYAKPENNPFHKKTGRAVYDALNAGNEED